MKSVRLTIFLIICFLALISSILAEEVIYEPVWTNESSYDIRGVTISKDGNFVAYSSDVYFYVFDKEGNSLWKWRTGDFVNGLSFSANGSYIGAVSDTTNVYYFNNIPSPYKFSLWSHDIGRKDVNIVALSDDSTHMVAGSDYPDRNVYFYNDKGVRLWKVRLGGEALDLAISANGSFAAAASADSDVWFFNDEGEVLWTYNFGRADATNVAMKGDGSLVAATDSYLNLYLIKNYMDEGGVHLWNTTLDEEVLDLSFGESDDSIIAATSKIVYFFSLEGELLRQITLQTPVSSVAMSGDAESIFGVVNKSVYYLTQKVMESSEDISSPRVVILANSIDFREESGLVNFYRENGFAVIHARVDNFDLYKEEKFILVLGGPDSPEGVGPLVSEVLTTEEADSLREMGAEKMFVKTNVWAESGQKVISLAGSNRNYTKAAQQSYRAISLAEFRVN